MTFIREQKKQNTNSFAESEKKRKFGVKEK
jgi:hypothetical protein